MAENLTAARDPERAAELYRALQERGWTAADLGGTEQEFVTNIEDPENARIVFQTLQKNGYKAEDIGETDEESFVTRYGATDPLALPGQAPDYKPTPKKGRVVFDQDQPLDQQPQAAVPVSNPELNKSVLDFGNRKPLAINPEDLQDMSIVDKKQEDEDSKTDPTIRKLAKDTNSILPEVREKMDFGNLADELENNKESYDRTIAVYDYQPKLRRALIDTDGKEAGEINYHNLMVGQQAGSYAEKKAATTDLVASVYRAIRNPDEQDHVVKAMAKDRAFTFGSELLYGSQEEFDAIKEQSGLNKWQAIALDFQDAFDPNKATGRRRILSSQPSDKEAVKGYEYAAREQEEYGLGLAEKALKEEVNKFSSLDPAEATEQQKQDLLLLEERRAEIEQERSTLDQRYPTTKDVNIDMLLQEQAGAKNNGVKQWLLKVGRSTDNTIAAIDVFRTKLFGSEEDLIKLEQEQIGDSQYYESAMFESNDQSLFQKQDLFDFGQLGKDLKAIDDNNSLTDDEKYAQKFNMIRDRQAEVKVKQNPNAGKLNLTGKTLLHTVKNVTGDMAGMLAMTAISGGGASASKLKQLIDGFGIAMATNFSTQYQQELKAGSANPIASATLKTGVDSLFEILNLDAVSLKKVLGQQKGLLGKLVSELTPEALDELVNQAKKTGLKDRLMRLGIDIGENGLEAVKEAATEEGGDFTNKLLGNALLNEDNDLTEGNGQSFTMTLFGLGPGYAASAPFKMRNTGMATKHQLFELGAESDKYKKILQDRIKAGTISPNEAAEWQNRIDRAQTAVAGVPELKDNGRPLSDNQKAKMAYNNYINAEIDKQSSVRKSPALQETKKALEKENETIASGNQDAAVEKLATDYKAKIADVYANKDLPQKDKEAQVVELSKQWTAETKAILDPAPAEEVKPEEKPAEVKPEVKPEEVTPEPAKPTPFPEPAKPVSEMDSSELRDHATEVQKHMKEQVNEVFGDQAAEYRKQQKIAESPNSTTEEAKAASDKVAEMEATLTKEQRASLFTPENATDPETLRTMANQKGLIEDAETVNDLAGALKIPLSDLSRNGIYPEAQAVLDAAKAKAVELGIDPTDLAKAAIQEATASLTDPADKVTVGKAIMKGLAAEPVKETAKPLKSSQRGPTARQQKINDLVDEAQIFQKMPKNEKGRAQKMNDLKVKAQALGLQYDDSRGKIRTMDGKKVQKREQKTANKPLGDFDATQYAPETVDVVSKMAVDENKLIGLPLIGPDGKRLNKKQRQQAIKAINEGTVTEGSKIIYDFFENAKNEGIVEVEDQPGNSIPVPYDEYVRVMTDPTEATDQEIETETAGWTPMDVDDIFEDYPKEWDQKETNDTSTTETESAEPSQPEESTGSDQTQNRNEETDGTAPLPLKQTGETAGRDLNNPTSRVSFEDLGITESDTMEQVLDKLIAADTPFTAIFEAAKRDKNFGTLNLVLQQQSPNNGLYYPQGNEQGGRLEIANQHNVAYTTAHEIAHFLSLDSAAAQASKGTPPYQMIEKIYRFIAGQKGKPLTELGQQTMENYGLTNVEEFMAELWINPAFRDYVADVFAKNGKELDKGAKYFTEKYGGKNMESRGFIEMIRDLFRQLFGYGVKEAEFDAQKPLIDVAADIATELFLFGPTQQNTTTTTNENTGPLPAPMFSGKTKQEIADEYKNKTYSDTQKTAAINKFKSTKAKEVKEPSRISRTWNAIKNASAYIDNPRRYITKLAEDINKMYNMPQSEMPLGRVFEQNSIGKSQAAAERFVDKVMRGLKKKSQFGNKTMADDFHDFIMAKRVMDRLTTEAFEKQVDPDADSRATGNITADDAQIIMNLAEEKGLTAGFEARAAVMQEMADDMMNRMLQSGVISMKAFAEIKTKNDFYAPFAVIQQLQRANDNIMGNHTVTSIMKKITGIQSKNTDTSLTDIVRMQDAFNAGQINAEELFDGATNLLDTLLTQGTIDQTTFDSEVAKLGEAGFQVGNIFDKFVNMVYDSYRIEEKNKQMNKVASLAVIDTKGEFAKIVPGNNLGKIATEKGWASVPFKQNGANKFLVVNENAAKVLNGMNDTTKDWFKKTVNVLNSGLRFGAITISPTFIIGNFALDFVRNATMTKYGLFAGNTLTEKAYNALAFVPQYVEAIIVAGYQNIVRPPLRGFGAAAKNLEQYETFLKSGGYSSGLYDNPFKTGRKDLKVTDPSHWTKVKSAAHGLVSLIDGIGRTLEQSHKMVQQQRGNDVEGVRRLKDVEMILGKAKTPADMAAALDKVAYEVQNLAGSPNFQETAAVMKTLSLIFQFMSARVKGTMSDLRRLSNVATGMGEGVKLTAAERGTIIAQLMTVALPIVWNAVNNYRNDDDEEERNKNMSEADRNKMLLIKTGDRFDAGDGVLRPDYIKMTVREVPAFFNHISNGMVDYLKHKDPKALKLMALKLGGEITPLDLQFEKKVKDGETRAEGNFWQSIVAGTTPWIKYPVELIGGKNMRYDQYLVPKRVKEAYMKGKLEPWQVVKTNAKGEVTTPQWSIDASKIAQKAGVDMPAIFLDHFENTIFGNALDNTAGAADGFKSVGQRFQRSKSKYPVWSEKGNDKVVDLKENNNLPPGLRPK